MVTTCTHSIINILWCHAFHRLYNLNHCAYFQTLWYKIHAAHHLHQSTPSCMHVGPRPSMFWNFLDTKCLPTLIPHTCVAVVEELMVKEQCISRFHFLISTCSIQREKTLKSNLWHTVVQLLDTRVLISSSTEKLENVSSSKSRSYL